MSLSPTCCLPLWNANSPEHGTSSYQSGQQIRAVHIAWIKYWTLSISSKITVKWPHVAPLMSWHCGWVLGLMIIVSATQTMVLKSWKRDVLYITSFRDWQNRQHQRYKEKHKKVLFEFHFGNTNFPLCTVYLLNTSFFNSRKVQRESVSCKSRSRKLAEFQTCLVAILTKKPLTKISVCFSSFNDEAKVATNSLILHTCDTGKLLFYYLFLKYLNF